MTFWWPVHRTRKQIISDNFNSMEQFYKLFAHQFDKKNSRVALSPLLTFYSVEIFFHRNAVPNRLTYHKLDRSAFLAFNGKR